MTVYVEVRMIMAVDVEIGPDGEYESLEDAALDPDFHLERLGNAMRMVEFDGYDVITDPDEVQAYSIPTSWDVTVAYRPEREA